MNKKFKITVSLIAVFVLVFGLNSFAFAGNEYTILSQGRFVDRNGTEDTSDDTVLFDSRDLVTLKTMVETGKTKLSTAINAYPNANVQTLDTFDNLSSAINNLTSVPDIYYYDKATEGDSCARYIYEAGSYYPCNEYGEKTSNTALTGTITVVTKDDTTEPAAGEIQLVKYEQTQAANLSAGSAGYVDKTFILGSGSDNISYRNLADATINTNSNNYKAGVAATKVGTAAAANVLSGKTFTNASGVGLTGTMKNNGAWTSTPTGSGKVTIPAGYHNGSGYVDTSSVYTKGYNDGKDVGTTTILNSFSGQELKYPSNDVTWRTTSGNISGCTKIDQYKWVYNTLAVAQISSPQYFSTLRIDYISDNGMQVDGVWQTYYAGLSVSFELKGDSGTIYYTGDGLSSINISSISEPVTLSVTWGVKHNDSSQTSTFKVYNIFATIK